MWAIKHRSYFKALLGLAKVVIVLVVLLEAVPAYLEIRPLAGPKVYCTIRLSVLI